MSFTNATLPKNQLCKQSPYHQQARRHRALLQIYLHAILLSTIYFRIIIKIDCDLPVPGGHVEE